VIHVNSTPMLLRTCLLFLLTVSPSVQSQPNFHWEGDQIKVGMGTTVKSKKALQIQAGADGRIFLSVAANGVTLDEFSRVEFEFHQPPPAGQFFVAWRTASGKEGMHPFVISGASQGTVTVSMSAAADWKGAADVLGLGIRLAPYSVVGIQSMSLSRSTLLSEAKERLHDWASLKPWTLRDINLYTGTRAFQQGVPPVLFFSRVLLAGLIGYLVYLLLTARLRQFNWHIAGILILACWIVLDLMWQVRLGQQARETYARFGGKSSQEKLLASSDAPIVRFITRVKKSVDGETPRIFVASANDYGAMLSAYYIAPINTYWHRGGSELPAGKFLSRGDYILLIAPFTTQYQPDRGLIRLPDSARLPVELVLKEQMGVLLRVI
jgi:hypothetical protein